VVSEKERREKKTGSDHRKNIYGKRGGGIRAKGTYRTENGENDCKYDLEEEEANPGRQWSFLLKDTGKKREKLWTASEANSGLR